MYLVYTKRKLFLNLANLVCAQGGPIVGLFVHFAATRSDMSA